MVSDVGLINEINQHRARLVLGFDTVFYPSWVGKIKTSFSWEGKGMVHTVCG